jgi:intracellular septation protein
VFELDEQGWRILTWRWAVFFVVLAVINEIVWRNFSFSFWAGFKLFGILPLTLVFAMAQMPVLMRHQVKPAE